MVLQDFLPVTVMAAIALFVVKEIVEYVKKKRADERKIAAYKLLIADEVEKNNWTLTTVRRTIKEIKDSHETHAISIYSTSNGEKRIKFVEHGQDERLGSSWPLTGVYNAMFAKLIADIAQVDGKLFSACAEAYAAVAELGHVRDGIIEYVCNENGEYHDGILGGFCVYAEGEIADTYIALAKLYKACTGKDLESHKLRSFT